MMIKGLLVGPGFKAHSFPFVEGLSSGRKMGTELAQYIMKLHKYAWLCWSGHKCVTYMLVQSDRCETFVLTAAPEVSGCRLCEGAC
jgi:hypothetical protein